MNSLHLAEGDRTAVSDRALCRKCGGAMKPGNALAQTFSSGSPDFPGDAVGITMSPAGPGKLIPCMKCEACGWSITTGEPAASPHSVPSSEALPDGKEGRE